MADFLTKQMRSEAMSRIRGRGNKSTEIALAHVFRRVGISGWRRHIKLRLKTKKTPTNLLVVRPDFVFRARRVAVFVDGCFWHQCPKHSKLPGDNREFWRKKLGANVARDRLVDEELRKAGWRVMRIWEHSLSSNLPALTRRLVRNL